MITKSALEFTSHIYDAVLQPSSWPHILDEFVDLIDAGGATLQVQDNMYSEHKCDAASALYRNDPNSSTKIEYYFGNLWKHDIPAYEYIHNNPAKGFIPDHIALGKDVGELSSHEPSIWLKDNFGVFHRAACRLNTSNAWYDYLAFQHRLDRAEASPEEIEFANLFVPHFAKVVELGRTFMILKVRFNALLAALDHYHIATFVTLSNGMLLVENSEARRILDRKDGLVRDRNGRLRLMGEKDAEFHRLIATVSATANCDGMDSEQLLTVPRRSDTDPYVLSICPLRDPDNLLEEHFRGAILYVIDPANVSIVSTHGIAKLYDLTPAEDAVCELLVKGARTHEIAETRSVTVDTVRSQIKSLLQKTGTTSRVELIKLALNINLPIDQPACPLNVER